MTNDNNKDKEHQDGKTAASSETVTSPQDAPSLTGTSAETRKQRCCLSQDNCRSSRNRDGKGSCTLPGSSQ